ncbi:MAG: polysaccharide biosynthesis C-terminal domain-containing protein [Saprospiraceae bacterium]|nr:polysaccharide biosynthesis C-terminal domain-containing protein [Saprospiraceae bacterium]
MNREFLINIIFLLFVNLLIKPFYIFGIELAIQNRVADGAYGLYFNLFSLTLILQIINDLGIQYYNNRNISQHNHLLSKYFPSMLLLKGLLGLVYFIVLLIVAWIWKYELEVYHLVLLIGLNQLLASLILFLRSNISGLAMYRTDSIISVLDRLLLIGICGVILWSNPVFKIEWFVYAQTTSLSITALIAFLTFRSRLQSFRVRFRPALLGLILKKSFPYALVVFLMGVYTRLDAVLLERLHPQGRLEADVYASAYRLLDAGNMLGFLFAGLLLPMFAKLLKTRDALTPLLKTSLQLIWAGAVTIAISVFFFQQEIMQMLYFDGDAYAGQVLGILMITFVAMSCTFIYGTLLTAHGDLWPMIRIFIIAIVLNITLNLLLIPQYGALGAGIAACFTQVFVAVAEVMLAHRLLQAYFNKNVILKLFLFVFLCLCSNYTFYYYIPSDWLTRFVVCIFTNLIIALVMRLINFRNALGLLQSERPD